MGERQRVALVAGVAVMPRLLLMDQPTTQLASIERDRVIDTVLRIHREIELTVVVVTHDVDVANRFERTVTIRDGRVGAEGRLGVEYAVIGRDGSLSYRLTYSIFCLRTAWCGSSGSNAAWSCAGPMRKDHHDDTGLSATQLGVDVAGRTLLDHVTLSGRPGRDFRPSRESPVRARRSLPTHSTGGRSTRSRRGPRR